MKTYHGDQSVNVTVDGRPLPPRLDLRNHSPDGFGWGYGGSGPAQLALALLADHLGDDQQALDLYQEFKWKFVAALAKGKRLEWTRTSTDIDRALAEIRAGRWFCRQCGAPINVGYSWEGMCVVCAQPHLSEPSAR